MINRKLALVVILRIIGTTSLLALIFVFVPYSLMNDIHLMLGMGVLPDQPVVGYLARSTSAFYAVLGGLLWLISFNIEHHRAILNYLGVAFMLFGAILLFVDWTEGMPLFWKLWEGPFVMVFGGLILVLNKTSR